MLIFVFFFFFQAEDGIRDLVRSRGLGDVYKRQSSNSARVGEMKARRRAPTISGSPRGLWRLQLLAVVAFAVQLVDSEQGRLGDDLGTHLRDPVLVPPGTLRAPPGPSTEAAPPQSLDQLVNGLVGAMRQAEAENKHPPPALLPEGGGEHDVPDRHEPSNNRSAWLPPSPCQCDPAQNHRRATCHLESLLYHDKRRWCRVHKSGACPHDFRYCSRRPWEVHEAEAQKLEDAASFQAKQQRDTVIKERADKVDHKEARAKAQPKLEKLQKAIEAQTMQAEKAAEAKNKYRFRANASVFAHRKVAVEHEREAKGEGRLAGLLAQENELREKALLQLKRAAHEKAVEVADSTSEYKTDRVGLRQTQDLWVHTSVEVKAKAEERQFKARELANKSERRQKEAQKRAALRERIEQLSKAKLSKLKYELVSQLRNVSRARTREAHELQLKQDHTRSGLNVSEAAAKERLGKWKHAEGVVETNSQDWRQSQQDSAAAAQAASQAQFDVESASREASAAAAEMKQAALAFQEQKGKLAEELTDKEMRLKRQQRLAEEEHKREQRMSRFSELRVKQLEAAVVQERKQKAEEAQGQEQEHKEENKEKAAEAARRQSKEKAKKASEIKLKLAELLRSKVERKRKASSKLKEETFKRDNELKMKDAAEQQLKRSEQREQQHEQKQKQAIAKGEQRSKEASNKANKAVEQGEKEVQSKELTGKRVYEQQSKKQEEEAENNLKQKEQRAEKQQKAAAGEAELKMKRQRRHAETAQMKVHGPELKLTPRYKWIRGYEPHLLGEAYQSCQAAFNSGVARCAVKKQHNPSDTFDCGCRYGLLALYRSATKFKSPKCGHWYGAANLKHELGLVDDFKAQQDYMTAWAQACVRPSTANVSRAELPFKPRKPIPEPDEWLHKVRRKPKFSWVFDPIHVSRSVGDQEAPTCVSEFYFGIASCRIGSLFQTDIIDPTSNATETVSVGDGCKKGAVFSGFYGQIMHMASRDQYVHNQCLAAHIKFSSEVASMLKDAPIQAVLTQLNGAVTELSQHRIELPKLSFPAGFVLDKAHSKHSAFKSRLGCRAKMIVAAGQCNRGASKGGYRCGCSKGMVVLQYSALSKSSAKHPSCVRWYKVVVKAIMRAEKNRVVEQLDFIAGWLGACAAGKSLPQPYTAALPAPAQWLQNATKDADFRWVSPPARLHFTHEPAGQLQCKSEFVLGVAVCAAGAPANGTAVTIGFGCNGKLIYAGLYGMLTYMSTQTPEMQQTCTAKHAQWSVQAVQSQSSRSAQVAHLLSSVNLTRTDCSEAAKRSGECAVKAKEKQAEVLMKAQEKRHEASLKASQKMQEVKIKKKQSALQREQAEKQTVRREKHAKAKARQAESLQKQHAKQEAVDKARVKEEAVKRKIAANKIRLTLVVEKKAKRKTALLVEKRQKSQERTEKDAVEAERRDKAAEREDEIAKTHFKLEHARERKAKKEQQEVHHKGMAVRKEEAAKASARREAEELQAKKSKQKRAQIILERAKEKTAKIAADSSRARDFHAQKVVLLKALLKATVRKREEALAEINLMAKKRSSMKIQISEYKLWEVNFLKQQEMSWKRAEDKRIEMDQKATNQALQNREHTGTEKRSKLHVTTVEIKAREIHKKRGEHDEREAATKAIAKQLTASYTSKLAKHTAASAKRQEEARAQAQERSEKTDAEAKRLVGLQNEKTAKAAEEVGESERKGKRLRIMAVATAQKHEREDKERTKQKELSTKQARVRAKLEAALARRALRERTAKSKQDEGAAKAALEAGQRELATAEERASKRKLQERQEKASRKDDAGLVDAVARAQEVEKKREQAQEEGEKARVVREAKQERRAKLTEQSKKQLEGMKAREGSLKEGTVKIAEKDIKRSEALKTAAEKDGKMVIKRQRLKQLLEQRKRREVRQKADEKETKDREHRAAARLARRTGSMEVAQKKAQASKLKQDEQYRAEEAEAAAGAAIKEQAAKQAASREKGRKEAVATQEAEARQQRREQHEKRAQGIKARELRIKAQAKAEAEASAAAEKATKRAAEKAVKIQATKLRLKKLMAKRKEARAKKAAVEAQESSEKELSAEAQRKERAKELAVKEKHAGDAAARAKLAAAEKEDKMSAVREKISKIRARKKEKREKQMAAQLEQQQKNAAVALAATKKAQEGKSKQQQAQAQRDLDVQERAEKTQAQAAAAKLASQEKELKAHEASSTNQRAESSIKYQQEMASRQQAAEARQKKIEQHEVARIRAMELSGKAKEAANEKYTKMAAVRKRILLLRMRKSERKSKRTENSPKKESEKKLLQKRLEGAQKQDEQERILLMKAEREAQQKQQQATRRAERAEQVLREQQAREQIAKERQKKDTIEGLQKQKRRRESELLAKKRVASARRVAQAAALKLEHLQRERTLHRQNEAREKMQYKRKTAELVSKAGTVEEATRIAAQRVTDRELKAREFREKEERAEKGISKLVVEHQRRRVEVEQAVKLGKELQYKVEASRKMSDALVVVSEQEKARLDERAYKVRKHTEKIKMEEERERAFKGEAKGELKEGFRTADGRVTRVLDGTTVLGDANTRFKLDLSVGYGVDIAGQVFVVTHVDSSTQFRINRAYQGQISSPQVLLFRRVTVVLPPLVAPKGFGFDSSHKVFLQNMSSSLGCIAKIRIAIAYCQRSPRRDGHYCGCQGKAFVAVVASSIETSKVPQCLVWYATVLKVLEIKRWQEIRKRTVHLLGWATSCAVSTPPVNANPMLPYNSPLTDPNQWLHNISNRPQFDWAATPLRFNYTYLYKDKLLCQSEFAVGVAVCRAGRIIRVPKEQNIRGLGLGCEKGLLFGATFGQLTYLQTQEPKVQRMCLAKHIQWSEKASTPQKRVYSTIKALMQAAAQDSKRSAQDDLLEKDALEQARLQAKTREHDSKVKAALEQAHSKWMSLERERLRVKHSRERQEESADKQIASTKVREAKEKLLAEKDPVRHREKERAHKLLSAQERSAKANQVKLLDAQKRAIGQAEEAAEHRMKLTQKLFAKMKSKDAHTPADLSKLHEIDEEVAKMHRAERTEKAAEKKVSVDVSAQKAQIQATQESGFKAEEHKVKAEARTVHLLERENRIASRTAKHSDELVARKQHQLDDLKRSERESSEQQQKKLVDTESSASSTVRKQTAKNLKKITDASLTLVERQEREAKASEKRMLEMQNRVGHQAEAKMKAQVALERQKLLADLQPRGKQSSGQIKPAQMQDIQAAIKEIVTVTRKESEAKAAEAAEVKSRESKVKIDELKQMQSDSKGLRGQSTHNSSVLVIEAKRSAAERAVGRAKARARLAEQDAKAAVLQISEVKAKAQAVEAARADVAASSREKTAKVLLRQQKLHNLQISKTVQVQQTSTGTLSEEDLSKELRKQKHASALELKKQKSELEHRLASEHRQALQKLRKEKAASDEQLLKAKTAAEMSSGDHELLSKAKHRADEKARAIARELQELKDRTPSPTMSPTASPTASPTKPIPFWTKRLSKLVKHPPHHTGEKYPKKDCQMSAWAAAGQCSRPCDGGLQNQTREVQVHPTSDGAACGPVWREVPCNSQPCCFPHCPPDISKVMHGDMAWMPPSGCSCKSHVYCDMRSLLTRGPPQKDGSKGSQMWCHTRERAVGCEHLWAWCEEKTIAPTRSPTMTPTSYPTVMPTSSPTFGRNDTNNTDERVIVADPVSNS
eukprot:TRINITY_DN9247_c0_g4_i1.p1 TRINITY_DN9247_c0_g4~~TRINITY_DN9247_c0_g4_i1.p1  ORF type:complete len:3685 (+),score=1365.37 TRINITY_DN9247_c0_g4_i1:10-11064(+)